MARSETCEPKGKVLAFCYAFAETGHPRNSAIEAGFSEKRARVDACELLAQKNVKAKIAELSASVQQKITEITAESKIGKILSYAESCVIQSGFVLDETASIRDRTAANALLGKMCGWHDEKPPETKPIEIKITYDK